MDIIIPTLLQSDQDVFFYSLEEANKSNHINNIFVIDNTGKQKFQCKLSKVNTIAVDNNIYVNPAWNLGVSLSKAQNIIIMNDDVACRTENYELIDLVLSNEECGLCSIKSQEIDNLNDYLTNFEYQDRLQTNNTFGNSKNNITGWFFALKRKLWKNIPHTIKIIHGDDLIYERIRKLGYETKNIINSTIGHVGSETVEKFMQQILPQVNLDIMHYYAIKQVYLEKN